MEGKNGEQQVGGHLSLGRQAGLWKPVGKISASSWAPWHRGACSKLFLIECPERESGGRVLFRKLRLWTAVAIALICIDEWVQGARP